MASEWNLWVWLECIGVVSGCCCKEVYRYPHNNYYFSLYSTCIHQLFFWQQRPYFFIHFFIQAPPAKMMSRSIIVHTLLSLRILHSLEHSYFMGGFLDEYLGISHHSLL